MYVYISFITCTLISVAHPRQRVHSGSLQSSPREQPRHTRGQQREVGSWVLLRPTAPPHPQVPHVGLRITRRVTRERLHQLQNEDAQQTDV